jgi:Icc-related predicted phosphoesterase
MRWRKSSTGGTGPTRRILFATDVHGSERCFRKFINAGSLYKVDYLILGGDITGKLLVPIVQQPNGTYDCRYGDAVISGADEAGVAALKERIRGFGHYHVVVSPDELHELQTDEARRDEVFREAVRTSVEDWVTLAEDRLRGSGIRCFVAPGNDDFLSIDSALESSEIVEFAENRVIELDETHQMITTGYSNPTPWDTERELPEEQLRLRIEEMAANVHDPSNMIAVLHPPPFRSTLDDAPELGDDLGMTLTGTGISMAPVGSTAVREFVESAQPLLGLHGHVHEGKGTVMIGRTLCINPGSDYTEGTLSAAIINIATGRVVSHQFVSG